MKQKMRTLILVLFLGFTPAQAQSLFGVLDPIYGAMCKPPAGASYSLAFALNLSSFCRTYETLKRFEHFGDYLEAIARGNLDRIPNLLLDAALLATNQALGNTPWYQDFSQGFNDFMDRLDQAAKRVYEAPARLMDNLATGLYSSLYTLVYNGVYNLANGQVQGKTYNLPDPGLESMLNDAVGDVPPITNPETAQDFGYLDSAKIQQYSASRKEVARLVDETTKALAQEAARQNDLARNQEAVQEAFQEAKGRAEDTLYRKMHDQQAEILNKISEAATMATVDDPITQQKGIAPRLREEAKNAPSDRMLLELQVEALASLIDQNAVYASKTAELIAETAKAQLLATRQIVDEIRKGQEEAKTLGRMLSPEVLMDMQRSKVEAAIAQSQTTVDLLKAVCLFHVGGEDNKAYCDVQ